MTDAVFVGHDIYRQAAYGNNHPLAISRVEVAVDICRDLDWFAPGQWIDSPAADSETLRKFHEADYIEALRNADVTGVVASSVRDQYQLGTMENPVFPGVFNRASTSVGGSIEASKLALEGRTAFHPAGGTHHGRPGRASGFCYFNDPVFAILTALSEGVTCLAYVDLDAHHGDGVQDAFADDPRVYTISIHEKDRWPYSGSADDIGGGQSCNLPVSAGFCDADLAVLMDELLLPRVEALCPEMIVITCGADGLAGDPLSRMTLTNNGLWTAVSALEALTPGLVVVGGGGYNPWTVARCWAGLWGTLAGYPVPAELPLTTTQRLRQLESDLVDEDDLEPHWLTSLLDLEDPNPVRPETYKLIQTANAMTRGGRWADALSMAAA